MKVIVHAEKCQGHGRCYDLAPNVFDADDEGHVALLVHGDVDAQFQREAQTAVENCPEHALELAD
jgi:ferredoxin